MADRWLDQSWDCRVHRETAERKQFPTSGSEPLDAEERLDGYEMWLPERKAGSRARSAVRSGLGVARLRGGRRAGATQRAREPGRGAKQGVAGCAGLGKGKCRPGAGVFGMQREQPGFDGGGGGGEE
jgi:hypothetical protein